MRLVNKNKIILDDKKASSNQISITFGSLDPIQVYISEKHEEKPVEQDIDIDGDEGWILVTSEDATSQAYEKNYPSNRLEEKF